MADAKTTTTAAPEAAPEVVKNCAGCNKPLKKKKRYYRNGKYYCNKNCFKTGGKSAEAQPAEAKAAKEKPKE